MRTVSSSNYINTSTSTAYSKCKLDSHADTIIDVSNCVLLSYSGKYCYVLPYRKDYESENNVPIDIVNTYWK